MLCVTDNIFRFLYFLMSQVLIFAFHHDVITLAVSNTHIYHIRLYQSFLFIFINYYYLFLNFKLVNCFVLYYAETEIIYWRNVNVGEFILNKMNIYCINRNM